MCLASALAVFCAPPAQNKSKVNTSDPRVLVKKLQKELEDMKRALAEAKAGGGGQAGGDGLGAYACGSY